MATLSVACLYSKSTFFSAFDLHQAFSSTLYTTSRILNPRDGLFYFTRQELTYLRQTLPLTHPHHYVLLHHFRNKDDLNKLQINLIHALPMCQLTPFLMDLKNLHTQDSLRSMLPIVRSTLFGTIVDSSSSFRTQILHDLESTPFFVDRKTPLPLLTFYKQTRSFARVCNTLAHQLIALTLQVEHNPTRFAAFKMILLRKNSTRQCLLLPFYRDFDLAYRSNVFHNTFCEWFLHYKWFPHFTCAKSTSVHAFMTMELCLPYLPFLVHTSANL